MDSAERFELATRLAVLEMRAVGKPPDERARMLAEADQLRAAMDDPEQNGRDKT